MVAVVFRRLGEHLARQDRRERRQRIIARARRLERVAAALDLAIYVAGLARHRRSVFELVVIRLELGVGDAPILDGHVGRDEALAVALLVEAADLELHVGPTPGVAAPVHGRAADDLAGQERAEPPHRQRFLRGIVAHRERVARGVLHEVVTHHVAQLVADIGHRIVLVGAAHRAALERDHLQPGLGQFLREDAAGPAQPDDDGVDFFQFGRHVVLLSSCRRC